MNAPITARSAGRMLWGSCCLALLLTLVPGRLSAATPDPMDWPSWRGPEQNGISRETGLIESWSPEGENLLWKRTDIGTISSPIVLRGKMYTLCRDEPGTPREREKVVCVDAASGKTIWENKFNVFLSDVPKERVAWSACVGDPETGHIYAMGVCGFFQCLDGETGKTLWSRSLSEELGLLSTYGGRTNTPIVFEDLVIISAVVIGWGDMARPTHRFMALDKQTGEVRWFNGTKPLPEDTTYSTPVVGVVGGQAVMIFGSGDGGLWAFQPRTGKQVWSYQLSRRGVNTSPILIGETVYCGHSEENPEDSTMGSLAAVNALGTGDITKTGEIWRIKELGIGKSSPLAVDDRLYVVDDSAGLFVVDAAKGKLIGKKQKLGTMMRSSLVWADGRIYTCEANGRWWIFKPTEKGLEVVHKVRLPAGEEVLGSPAVSHGRIYLPSTGAIYCLGKKDAKPQATPIPAPAAETPVADDKTPALVQVVPAEVLMKPGAKQAFQVRLFNAKGQLLDTPAKATFSVAAGGAIDSSGNFVADSVASHHATIVTAKVGDLQGQARVRVVPPLPWKFDFAGGEIPVTWVGVRYRHITLDENLFDKLTKEAPLAGKLYVHALTEFINGGKPQVKFDEALPRQTWSVLMRYLGLADQVGKNVDAAKAALEAPLGVLKRENILASWTWGNDPAGGPQLVIQRGPRKYEGNVVATKITTIPKGMRSQGWMGHVDMHDYTIQADVRGEIRDNKLPDMGLIAQRYTLDLMGASQQLQIRSWTPELDRMSKSVPFKWEPHVWYTLKFRASVEDGVAVLRGKVWKRGEAEPKNWTVEARDEVGNLTGSPGLFGNATNAEIFIDNISVTPNG
ncbi:MAG: PQQ-like beta-propeller repeat protein [Pirellulales bacterium]|nr:PQQ-like beta-propeller repeat protein [Pirellulales bacterium]